MTDSMTSTLSRTRCFHHPDREAVGRCPDCGHFFCRECLIEHDGRMTCTRCLAERTGEESSETRRFRISSVLMAGLSWTIALMSFWVVWGFFYVMGRILIFLRHEWQELLL